MNEKNFDYIHDGIMTTIECKKCGEQIVFSRHGDPAEMEREELEHLAEFHLEPIIPRNPKNSN